MTADERSEFVALRHVLETYSVGCRRQAGLMFNMGHSIDSAEAGGKADAYQHAADYVGKVLAKTDQMTGKAS